MISFNIGCVSPCVSMACIFEIHKVVAQIFCLPLTILGPAMQSDGYSDGLRPARPAAERERRIRQLAASAFDRQLKSTIPCEDAWQQFLAPPDLRTMRCCSLPFLHVATAAAKAWMQRYPRCSDVRGLHLLWLLQAPHACSAERHLRNAPEHAPEARV